MKPTTTTTNAAAEPADTSARAIPHGSNRYRRLLDRAARVIIGLGGITIVVVIFAILLVLLIEVAPLFQAPAARPLGSVTAPAVALPVKLGVDEYRELGYVANADGVKIFSLKDGSTVVDRPVPSDERISAISEISLSATSEISQGKFSFATESGKLIFAEVKFEASFADEARKTEADATLSEPMDVSANQPIRVLAYRDTKDGPIAAAAIGAQDLAVVRVTEQKALIGESTFSQESQQLTLPINGEITALAADNRAEDIFIGTSDGQLARVNLREGAPQYAEAVPVNGNARITALNFLLGDRTLIVGDAQGHVSSWQVIADASGEPSLQRMHEFAAQSGGVTLISPSNRDKGFLTGDESGGLQLHYATTGRTRLNVRLPVAGLQALAYAPRADGFVALTADGTVHHYDLENQHPEITLASLFGKVQYEGYNRPEHSWQSSGGADDFEAKFGLVPLIYGTLKGSFYTLIFSVPLALLAALYTAQFLKPRWKSFIKPTVEIMAGLPSVVLGFIAALWLAPNIEKVLPGVLVMPVIVGAMIVAAVLGWRRLPMTYRSWIKPGRELIALIPVILLGIWLSLHVSDFIAHRLMGGDYHTWLTNRLGLAYDQRNSLVVSLAMGFAVIPIIFTIAEDAFANVPRHLTLAARALGANPWQTAVRVVLPTASPGIFSAIMVGMGRAVGETMIVLMATGNTPIMEWNLFNGFRALSANIAVELPEAPAGGTLYRVLFLTALLLFILTFIVNTAAEVVRLRLRKRYSSL